MAASTLVTFEQYLNTSYRPDVEFIDGELKEKMGFNWTHSRLLALLAGWFGRHEEKWGVLTAVKARTRVSASRVRLPDLAVVRSGPQPDVLIEPPLIVAEVISPEDSDAETEQRAQDYRRMGIANIWLLDPESRTARTCRSGAWVKTTRLFVEGTGIYLDAIALFWKLDQYNSVPSH